MPWHRCHAEWTPLERTLDESFLGSLAEEVVESFNLCRFFVGDLNGPVSSGEELLLPAVDASNLSRDV